MCVKVCHKVRASDGCGYCIGVCGYCIVGVACIMVGGANVIMGHFPML